MKRVLLLIIVSSFLLSGCYLLPETALTPTTEAATGTLAPTTAATGTSAGTVTATLTPARTVTSSVTPTRTQTSTPAITRTPTKTFTPTKTSTPTRTATPTSTSTPLPYTLQEEAPSYTTNFAHTDAGCNWLGLAGQVFGADGTPQLNLVVVVKGKLGSVNLDLAGVTGIPEADVYGPGGYEIKLADAVSASSGKLTVQIFDLNGKTLSAVFPVDTYADCNKNLIVINFIAQ